MEHLLEVQHPFRLDLALRYLATSPSTIAERVTPSTYGRAFWNGEHAAALRMSGGPGGLRVQVSDGSSLDQALALVASVFSVHAPLPVPPSSDPVMAERFQRYRGLRILTIPDPFEAIVWAILGQQINVAFAAKCKRALMDAYGDAVEVDGQRYQIFPRPERLVDVTAEEMRPLQISRQKAEYIRDLARVVCDGEVDFGALRSRTDEEVVERVVRLRGIGLWTAEYLLLRGFGRTDAIPAGDMGLRAIVGRLYGLDRHATEMEVRHLAEGWAPWRGYAAFYLWFALQQRDFEAAAR